MGWWAHGTDGNSLATDSELLWGDSPADTVDEHLPSMLRAIVNDFVNEVGRKPTAEEIKAGILFSLDGAIEDVLE